MSFSTTNKRRKWTHTGHFIISDLISPRLILSYLLVSASQQLTSHGSEDQHFANLSLVTVFMEYYLSAPQSFHTRPSFQASKTRNQNFIPWHHPNHFLELCQPIQAVQLPVYIFSFKAPEFPNIKGVACSNCLLRILCLLKPKDLWEDVHCLEWLNPA